VDRPRSNDAINDQGQRLTIRGERESPGILQAIASFKRAASSRVAYLGDQEKSASNKCVCVFACQFACTHSDQGVDFKALAFIDEN